MALFFTMINTIYTLILILLSESFASRERMSYFEPSFFSDHFQIHPFSQLVDEINVGYHGRADVRPPLKNYRVEILHYISHCVVLEMQVHKFYGVTLTPRVGIVLSRCEQISRVCHGK